VGGFLPYGIIFWAYFPVVGCVFLPCPAKVVAVTGGSVVASRYDETNYCNKGDNPE
jgi:hypothetical protein